jgi:transposase
MEVLSKKQFETDQSTQELLADLSNEKLIHVIGEQSNVISEQQKRITILEEYLRLERARLFGRSSEKHPGQGEIFNEAELEGNTGDTDADVVEVTENEPPKKKSGGRKALSKSLPREQLRISLTEAEKVGAIDTFYTVVKEELDIQPAVVRVIEHLQEKAVFIEDGQRNIKSAALPKHPLPKCIASVGLLAYIIVAKYCDALPLYRLEKILARYGGEISRTSMASWMIRLSLQLQPLVNLMREHQLQYDYIHLDETRIQVLKEPGFSATGDKWMWVSRGGPPDKTSIIFEYDPSRSKEVPLRLYETFKGYCQVDGYAGYNAICKPNDVTRVGCWDHARRKFTDAKKAASTKKHKKSDVVAKFDIALSKIGKLYAIERELKLLSAQEKHQQRQSRSIPALNDLKAWLDNNVGKVDKDSKTGKAIRYAINQWPTLTVYCEDGRLNIANIEVERAIRPFAQGRRAWLFADTPKGARASAVLYSLIESAKANNLDPYAYLLAVLKRLPYAETLEQVEKLLPWNIEV